VPETPVTGHRFEGVGGGVAEVEDAPGACVRPPDLLTLVARDDFRLKFALRGDQIGPFLRLRGRVAAAGEQSPRLFEEAV